MRETAAPEPGWVIVAGGFHQQGGMDKANAALARYLSERGAAVDLVAHRVDPAVASLPGVTVHLVTRPFGSFAIGEMLLDRAGRAVAGRATTARPGTRVVVNGGNCHWPDVNWVHAVHHAWPPVDRGAPAWFRLKNRVAKQSARRRERRTIGSARVVVANSERTKSDLVDRVGIDPGRVRTVYLGSDEGARAASPFEREAARAWLGCRDATAVVAFIGPLGRDLNKGFDTLWAAWRRFAADEGRGAHLVAAGAGAAGWRREAAACGGESASRIHFTGYTDRVNDVLSASDLLVSPVRYEAYGLNVHEALCRDVPAIVSRAAGVAERYPASLSDLTLANPDDVEELLAALGRWHKERDCWRERVRPLGTALRSYTWADMAASFVSAVCQTAADAASA